MSLRRLQPALAQSVTGSDQGAVLPLLQRLALCLSDLPFLSRTLGHLMLVLLLAIIIWNVSPSQLETPALDGLVAMEADMAEEPPLEVSADTTRATGYLQPNPVPLTVRAVRDVLPMAIMPQRTVRTTVSIYRVQSGDTVLGIAQKFGLKGTTLLWSNDPLVDDPDSLQVGQAINILPIDGAYHTVAKGETLQSIAAKYKVEAEAVSGYGGNGLSAPYTLETGQRLIIPNGTKPPPPPRRITVSSQVARAPQGANTGSGRFGWPIGGMISQKYWAGHQAIDIAGPSGTAIVAADAGYVSTIEVSSTGYGKMIIIDHGNGFQTLYAHLSGIKVEAGQSVARGEVIGLRGSTGRSTGPHLHFAVLLNHVPVDPFDYLP